MKTAILTRDPTTYLLVFDPDEEVMGGLLPFVRDKQITAGHLTAIGAVSKAMLGFFDRKTKDYSEDPPGRAGRSAVADRRRGGDGEG